MGDERIGEVIVENRRIVVSNHINFSRRGQRGLNKSSIWSGRRRRGRIGNSLEPPRCLVSNRFPLGLETHKVSLIPTDSKPPPFLMTIISSSLKFPLDK